MTKTEVIDLIKSIRSKKSRLLSLQEYMEEERKAFTGLKAVCYDTVAVVSSNTNKPESAVMKYLEKIEKIERIYNQILDEMMQEEDLLAKMMEKLTATEYEVILNRYLRGKSAAETAKIMKYDSDYIRVLCSRTREKMAKTQNDNA